MLITETTCCQKASTGAWTGMIKPVRPKSATSQLQAIADEELAKQVQVLFNTDAVNSLE